MVKFDKFTIMRILELILAIVCIALFETNRVAGGKPESLALEQITYAAFIIITFGTMMSALMDWKMDKKVVVIYCVTGAVLFLVSGIITIMDATNNTHGSDKTIGIIIGVLALVNGVVFIVDTIFTWKEG